jgi:hypothetical protein
MFTYGTRKLRSCNVWLCLLTGPFYKFEHTSCVPESLSFYACNPRLYLFVLVCSCLFLPKTLLCLSALACAQPMLSMHHCADLCLYLSITSCAFLSLSMLMPVCVCAFLSLSVPISVHPCLCPAHCL